MPQFFLNKKFVIALISIILIIALVGYTYGDRFGLTFPERVVNDIGGSLQKLVKVPVGWVSDYFAESKDLKTVYQENEKLKSRLQEYVELKSKLYSLEKENEELKKIQGLDGSLNDYKKTTAKVIGRSADRWFDTITIDKGKSSGIQTNMAVITEKGLIGRVKTTTEHTSVVELFSASDAMNRVNAQIQSAKPVYGVLEGYDKETGSLLVKRIDVNVDVQINANVISSGYGGVFPKGLLIGKVIDVKMDDYGLSKTAIVEPYADFYDINTVIVIERTTKSSSDKDGGGGL